MSKKHQPLDFKHPQFKQSLKVNPLKVLTYQKQRQTPIVVPVTHPKPSVPIHKNIIKPTVQKQSKVLPFKTKMCPFGRDCKHRMTCRFAHSQKELRRPFYKRTKPCLLYQRGMCSLGSACREYHGNFDLKSWNQNNYKKQLCEDFQKGDCPQGKLCVRAHGKQELEQYTNMSDQDEVPDDQDQKQKKIVIKLDTYKPNTYTMSLVSQERTDGPVQVIQSVDLFVPNAGQN